MCGGRNTRGQLRLSGLSQLFELFPFLLKLGFPIHCCCGSSRSSKYIDFRKLGGKEPSAIAEAANKVMLTTIGYGGNFLSFCARYGRIYDDDRS